MKLTGKAKEDFEKWYLEDMKNYSDRLISGTGVEWFNLLTESMQWGVYVDFFDEKGGIDVLCRFKHKRYLSWAAPHVKDDVYLVGEHKTRSEARKAAIEKANQIYNS